MPGPASKAFEAVAGDLLQELGYERRHSSTTTSLRMRAAFHVAHLNARGAGSRYKKAFLETVAGKPPAGISRTDEPTSGIARSTR
jgi:hypothetical protein